MHGVLVTTSVKQILKQGFNRFTLRSRSSVNLNSCAAANWIDSESNKDLKLLIYPDPKVF